MVKKIVACLLTVAMSVSMLTGCGGSDESGDKSGKAENGKKAISFNIGQEPTTLRSRIKFRCRRNYGVDAFI